MKKSKDKGYSLIMVIIVVAIVSIMVTTILAVTSVNIQMKAIKKQSIDNFYDAETAMDEIKVGLQNDVSNSAQTGYMEALGNFEQSDEQEMQLIYKTAFKNTLSQTISGTDQTQAIDVIKQHLLSFLSSDHQGLVEINNISFLVLGVDSVRLQQVEVVYTDAKNFQTIITTDLVMYCPEVQFSSSTEAPDLINYCLVGQDYINFTSANSVAVNGNVMAGKNWNDGESTGLNLNAGSDVVFSNGTIVAEDGITVNSATMLANNNTTIWTQGILVNGGGSGKGLNSKGRIYTSGDLEASGNADVAISGQYYGFGNPSAFLQSSNLEQQLGYEGKITPGGFTDYVQSTHPGYYSSSIILNSLGDTGSVPSIDLSRGLTQLFLAGNAYISNGTNLNENSVLMGESVGVKSDQIAYLIPNSCMKGEYTNPMKVSGGVSIPSDYYNNSLLATYMSGYGITNHYSITTKVDSRTGATYFFINFDDALTANKYFRSYYANATNKAKLDGYIERYAQEIKISGSSKTSKILNGNLIIYDSTGIYLYSDTITEEAGDDATDLTDALRYKTTCANWEDRLIALVSNLSSSVSSEQIRERIFNNMVSASYFDSMSTDEQVVFSFDGSQALVVNGDYVEGSGGPDVNAYHMIIANGDVELNSSFSGAIIASGGITVNMTKTDPQISSNSAEVLKLIGNAVDGSGNRLSQVMNYEVQYSTGASTSGLVDTDVSKYVTFENWKKE